MLYIKNYCGSASFFTLVAVEYGEVLDQMFIVFYLFYS